MNEKGEKYDGVVVMVPCLNEEKTIAKVVDSFKSILPGAEIYVFDNNSTDKTARIARECGATVVYVPIRGKGNVVKKMFDLLEAEIFVMVDGDDTYPAESAPELIAELRKGEADMVVGARLSTHGSRSFRKLHRLGNKLVSGLISFIFQTKVIDVMSGYRVFSWNFVKSIPLMSEGFDIETEMTLQTLAKGYRLKEISINYGERPEGSLSKLSTFSDGFLVLKTIFLIFKDYKPFLFFCMLASFLAICSLAAGYMPIVDYVRTRYVYHVPLAILASGLGILSAFSLGLGLILDTISKYHNESFVVRRRMVTNKSAPHNLARAIVAKTPMRDE